MKAYNTGCLARASWSAAQRTDSIVLYRRQGRPLKSRYRTICRTMHRTIGYRCSHGRRLWGGQGRRSPTFGVGDKVSYIPNIFTVQKVIFNAFSVLGCFCKKLQQIWGDVEKNFSAVTRRIIEYCPPNFKDKSPPLVAAVHIHDIS
jgi:hypothetical protein